MSALELTKKAVQRRSPEELAKALISLMADAPDDWDSLLLLHATPDANVGSFSDVLKLFIDAARIILEQTSEFGGALRLVRHLIKMAYFRASFKRRTRPSMVRRRGTSAIP